MIMLSGHFCKSLHVRHARRKQASIKVQEYLPEAQIKTKTIYTKLLPTKRLVTLERFDWDLRTCLAHPSPSLKSNAEKSLKQF